MSFNLNLTPRSLKIVSSQLSFAHQKTTVSSISSGMMFLSCSSLWKQNNSRELEENIPPKGCSVEISRDQDEGYGGLLSTSFVDRLSHSSKRAKTNRRILGWIWITFKLLSNQCRHEEKITTYTITSPTEQTGHG